MTPLQLTYPKHRSEQRAFLKGNTMSLQWALAAFSQALGYPDSPAVQLFDSEEQGENYAEERRAQYRGEAI